MLKVRSSKIPNIGKVSLTSQSCDPPNRLGYFSLGANTLSIWHKLEQASLSFRLGQVRWSVEEKLAGLTVLGLLLGPIIGLLLWAASLPAINPDQMNDFGLISVLPPMTYAALAILIVSFSLAVYRRQTPLPILLVHVAALAIMLHGIPPLVYGTLRYSWAWKHIGIVDYIQRFGVVNPNISVLNAYHNWPGFFTLSVFIDEVAGLDSPLGFAPWAPIFFSLVNLGVLFQIFKTFTQDQRLIGLGLWIYFLTNWIGQDYYSPQAMNYFLHLVIVAICLRWFYLPAPPSPESLKRWLRLGWLTRLAHNLLSRAARNDLPLSEGQPAQRVGLMLFIIILYAVIASSHQLTPFMTISAVAALVIFQRCRARALPILLAFMAIGWILSGAFVFFEDQLQDIISSIGQVAGNVDANLLDLSKASVGQQVVAWMSRGLTAGLWGLAFLGGLRRLRHGYWDLSVIVLAVAPFAILGGNSYGGEILFRVYLFALPFMSFFAAALVYPASTSGRSWPTVIVTVILSLALLTGFGFAHYGKDKQYRFTRAEVEASQYLYSTAPPNSLLVDGSRNYPSQFKNYEYFTYVALDRESPKAQAEFIKDPVAVFSRWLDNDRYAATYLFITRSQKITVDAVGSMPAGSLDIIEQALLQSPKFKVIYSNQDAKIFVLADDTNAQKEDKK